MQLNGVWAMLGLTKFPWIEVSSSSILRISNHRRIPLGMVYCDWRPYLCHARNLPWFGLLF